MSLPYFEKLLQSRRPGLCIAKASLGLVDLELAKELEIPGEYLCVPDLTSLRVCPYAPGEASVMGWLQDKNPASKPGNNPSVEVDICPRSLLARVVKYVVLAVLVSRVNMLLQRSTNRIQRRLFGRI